MINFSIVEESGAMLGRRPPTNGLASVPPPKHGSAGDSTCLGGGTDIT